MKHYFFKKKLKNLIDDIEGILKCMYLKDDASSIILRKDIIGGLMAKINTYTLISMFSLKDTLPNATKSRESLTTYMAYIEKSLYLLRIYDKCLDNMFYIDRKLVDSIDIEDYEVQYNTINQGIGSGVQPYDNYCVCSNDKQNTEGNNVTIITFNFISDERRFIGCCGYNYSKKSLFFEPTMAALYDGGISRDEDGVKYDMHVIGEEYMREEYQRYQLYLIQESFSINSKLLLMLKRKSTKTIIQPGSSTKERRNLLRQGLQPIEEYKSLVVKLGKQVFYSEKVNGGLSDEMALHSVRAHTKTFTAEKPMFGNPDLVGTYIIPSFVKGNKNVGEIKKEYIIKE